MDRVKKHPLPFVWKMLLAFFALAGSFLVAMVFGAADTDLEDVWQALFSEVSSEKATMLRELRLPREVGAILVGAALSVSGAIVQGLTRNPLADPGLLGLTAGANMALAVCFALWPAANYLGITMACFMGASLGAALVFGIARLKKGGFSPFRIVLAGAAISAFLHAVAEGIGLYFKITKDVSMWTAGGLVGTTWSQLRVITPFIVLGILLALFLSRHLTILSFHEEVAIGLGQKITLIKSVLFILIIVLAGASVALVGNMAFIGLMIPHLVRHFTGTDYRFIIPMCAVGGAAFMLLTDTISRTIHAPYETPLAAIVCMMGLPFFLMIVMKGGKGFQ